MLSISPSTPGGLQAAHGVVGTLEQMALSGHPLTVLVLGKVFVHWCATGLLLLDDAHSMVHIFSEIKHPFWQDLLGNMYDHSHTRPGPDHNCGPLIGLPGFCTQHVNCVRYRVARRDGYCSDIIYHINHHAVGCVGTEAMRMPAWGRLPMPA